MAVKSIFIAVIIWPFMLGSSLGVPKSIHKATQKEKSDVKGVDEVQIKYPNIELEVLCKGTENPQCESIIDHFCDKTCISNLCAKHGSIRSMCRMVCETEDLVPECSKMGPSKVVKKSLPKKQFVPAQSYEMANAAVNPSVNQGTTVPLNQIGQYYPQYYPSYPTQ